MSAFTGAQGKGAAKRRREQKRQEAEARNAATPHDRTRAHRLGKCSPATHLLREVFGAAS